MFTFSYFYDIISLSTFEGGFIMAKVKTFYAVFVHDDERGGEIKAYCRTKEK